MKYSKGSANLTVVLPVDIVKRLNELAEKKGVSRNSLMVIAITKLINDMEGREE